MLHAETVLLHRLRSNAEAWEKLRESFHIMDILQVGRRIKPAHPKMRAKICEILQMPESEVFDKRGFARVSKQKSF